MAKRAVTAVEQELAYADEHYRRAVLPEWDERWRQLSPAARRAFARAVEQRAYGRLEAGVEMTPAHLSAAARDELIEHGFLTAPPGRPAGARLFLGPLTGDFALRLRAILRQRPLTPARYPFHVSAYLYQNFKSGAHRLFQDVLRQGGQDPMQFHNAAEDRVVSRRDWPGWAVDQMGDPLARRIVDLLRDQGPLSLAELPSRLSGARPDAVRTTLERLRLRLVVFEDLDDEYDLRVGLLPAVRETLLRPQEQRQRPELRVCPPPAVVGPPDGVVPGDLRTVLFELATEPARVKRGGELYSRDADRIAAVLEPLPEELARRLHWSEDARLGMALEWAHTLKLVRTQHGGEQSRMQLTPGGRDWLALPPDRQFAALCDYVRQPPAKAEWDGFHSADWLFLRCNLTVVPGKQRPYTYGRPAPEQRQPWRDALYRAFRELPLNVFVRLNDFLAHATFGASNPVLLGREPAQVTVTRYNVPIPPLDDELEEAGRQALEEVLRERLLPLGCVQVGLATGKKELRIARRPRLDVFFGHEPESDGQPATADVSRVIVQPDFTIVVIGMNPAPAAELLPFCERQRGGVNQGSLTLRLTRDSVLHGLAGGLKGKDILERLKTLASVPLPPNVEEEVRGWVGRVGTATLGTAVLLRCADKTTADRAATALGKNAERLSDTVLALVGVPKSSEVKKKLLAHGILLESGAVTSSRKGK